MHRFHSLRTKSYMDRVQAFDCSNRVFYIYYVGSYHNKPMFHYGEADHIDLVELRLRRILPYYQCITYTPVRHLVSRRAEFEKAIQDRKVVLPVLGTESWDAFTYPTDELEALSTYVDHLYQVQNDG